MSKIFGVFTVKSKQTGSVHFFIMENTMRLKKPDMLKYVFDLKGSTVDRIVKGAPKNSTTLKDSNFLMARKAIPDLTTLLGRDKSRVVKAIRSDVQFLQEHGLMDYSLLLGIESYQEGRR